MPPFVGLQFLVVLKKEMPSRNKCALKLQEKKRDYLRHVNRNDIVLRKDHGRGSCGHKEKGGRALRPSRHIVFIV